MSKIVLYNSADVPATPPAGQLVFFTSGSQLYTINDQGNISGPGANPEYRWSTFLPLDDRGTVVLPKVVAPARIGEGQQELFGIPVSDPNAGSIVGFSVNILYNDGGNEFNELSEPSPAAISGGDRTYNVYINGNPTSISVTVPELETGVFSSQQTVAVSFGDVVAIGTEDENYVDIYGVASVTFSSAPGPEIPQ